MDVQLEFLNAAHGDSILVSWDDPPHLAIFDGGPTGSFEKALGPRLDGLRRDRVGEDDPLPVDLVYVSHIDDDHIAGIVRLLRGIRQRQRDQLPAQYRVDRLWHNSFEELVVSASGASLIDVEREAAEMSQAHTAVAASVNQGRDVRDLGQALGVAGNQPFGGAVIGGVTTTLAGLQLTVASPDPGALARLEEEWRKAKRSNKPSVLSAAFTDDAVPNLSSLCTVIGGSNGGALLTGDARGDHLMTGLEAIGILPSGGSTHFEVFQVPHHGSLNNSDPVLYERISADHYVISADGIKHRHPDPSVLDMIVQSRGTDGYTIHLTNPIPAAVAHLQGLSQGRNFTIDARADPAPGVVVDFAA